ncbi:MAG: helicase HerA domain-containing protein [Nitrososphaeraceae archaeon]
MDLISTGSPNLDRFLRGGIRTGIITNIFGESGSGKSQFCFSICANLLKKNEDSKIIFIDTSGNFRPERILDITDNPNLNKTLHNIQYIRPYSLKDQFEAIKKIYQIKPKLVVIDTITSLIAIERKNIPRHLMLMKFIHELAHSAINTNCAIVTTNMVRNIIYENSVYKNSNKTEEQQKKIKLQREFMEKSVSLSIHIKLKFEIISISHNCYKVSFLQPFINDSTLFRITREGVL